MKIALLFGRPGIDMLYTPKAFEELLKVGEVVYKEDYKPEDAKEVIKDADIVITTWGSPKLETELLDCAPNLKLVVHAAGSVKPIVSDELWKRGVRVCASTKPLGIGVAETSLGLVIASCKNFFQLNDELHEDQFKIHDVKDLYEITVGIVSAGFVGRHHIKLLNNFGINILVYDPYVSEERAKELGAKKVDFETLLKESDVVSLHAPSIPATRHIINADTLKLMKKDAVLINTARGSLIDEKALYDHMVAGNLKYACLDVYDPEPLPVESPLRTVKNIILTPHIAGLAINGKLRIGPHATSEIKKFIAGEKPDCEVTESMLATIA